MFYSWAGFHFRLVSLLVVWVDCWVWDLYQHVVHLLVHDFLLVASDLIALLSGLVPLLPWLLALWSGSTLWAWFTLWAWPGLLISRLIRISFFFFLRLLLPLFPFPSPLFSPLFLPLRLRSKRVKLSCSNKSIGFLGSTCRASSTRLSGLVPRLFIPMISNARLPLIVTRLAGMFLSVE